MSRIQTEFDFYRNAQAALVGTADGANWAYPGSALSASSIQFWADQALGTVAKARWCVAWNPNTGSSPTAVRLVYADLGPANLVEIAKFTRTNQTTPLVDQIDITQKLNDLIAAGAHKQFLQQTAGNGGNGCLIYGSWIEIVWDLP
jgi:hypothetical protein